MPLVAAYESQPIVRDMSETATAFPLTRTHGDQVHRQEQRGEALLHHRQQRTRRPTYRRHLDPKKDRKGPLTLGAAGTYNTGKSGVQGRFVVVGSSLWVQQQHLVRFNGNRDLFLNMMNWLTRTKTSSPSVPRSPRTAAAQSTGKMRVVFWLSVVFFPLVGDFLRRGDLVAQEVKGR